MTKRAIYSIAYLFLLLMFFGLLILFFHIPIKLLPQKYDFSIYSVHYKGQDLKLSSTETTEVLEVLLNAQCTRRIGSPSSYAPEERTLQITVVSAEGHILNLNFGEKYGVAYYSYPEQIIAYNICNQIHLKNTLVQFLAV